MKSGQWVIIFLIGLWFCSCGDKQQTSRPNVIVIYADDMGYGDVSCYGSEIPTPNIDAIAKAGVRFTDFYVTAPACTPSRYSLLTGSYPQRSVGGLNYVLMPGLGYHFAPEEKLVSEYMKETGYETAIFGKWHLGAAKPDYFPRHHGFDRFSGLNAGCVDYFQHTYGGMGKKWYINHEAADEKGYATDLITNYAISFIDEMKDKDKPFFIYLPYNAPHYGKSDPSVQTPSTLVMYQGKYKGYDIANTLQAPPAYVERFKHIEHPHRKHYAAMVANMDDNIGRILQTLKTNEQYKETIVWFISDNGGYSISYYAHASNGRLKGEKGTLMEGGIRIPSVVCWEGHIPAGITSRQAAINLDVLPTLASLCGFEQKLSPKVQDGTDVSGVLLGKDPFLPEARTLYWRYNKETALRQGQWKLYNYQELYDLGTDPEERTNLAGFNSTKLKELQSSFTSKDKELQEYYKTHSTIGY